MDYFYETIKMLKNRNYKIIFKHAEKSKYGTESFIYNSGRGINKDIYIKDIKDFYGEKRKKKKVIGTTLVNLINALPAIEKNIKNCLAETRSFNFNKVEEFYQKAFFIIDKSNICNLANIEEYHLLINEFLQKQIKLNGLDFDEINALKKFISQASDNEIISVCNVYIDIFELRKKSKLLISIGNLCNNIMFIAKKGISKEQQKKLIESEMTLTLKNYVDVLMSDIVNILGDYHFIITTFISNFLYDYDTTFRFNNKDEFHRYKNIVTNMAFYTDPSNTYYKELYYYLEQIDYKGTDDYKSLNFLKRITRIFLISLYEDIKSITKWLSEEQSFIILPKVEITYSKKRSEKSYTYSISKLKDFIDVSLYHISMDNRKLLKCKNCGRYFISDVRNNEVFCRRIDPNDPKKRRCSVIGVEKNRYVKSDDPRRDLYKKIYNRLHNGKDKRYDKEECTIFVEEYKKYKQELSETSNKFNYDKKYMNKFLIQWLKKYDEKLMKKYPSNRYGLKKKKDL